MNEETLLAGKALFIQSGALLVSHNGFINFFEPAGRQVISTTPAAPHREL
jgi:hypothetical protein